MRSWLGEPIGPSREGDCGLCKAGNFWLGDPLDAGIIASRRLGEVATESSGGAPFANDPWRSTVRLDDVAASWEELLASDFESTPFVTTRIALLWGPMYEGCDAGVSAAVVPDDSVSTSTTESRCGNRGGSLVFVGSTVSSA